MVILITGVTGYIASELLKRESKDNYIYAVARKQHKGTLGEMKNVEYVYCDMDEYDLLWEKIHRNIDCVIHCAWGGCRGNDNRNEDVQTNNTSGTMKLLYSILRLNCKKWIQIGSLAEYGQNFNEESKISEETYCNPQTPYAREKYRCFISIEQECREKGLNFCEVRLGSVYGPNMQKNTVIRYVVDGLLNNHDVELISTCNQLWEFVYIGDVIEVLDRIIRQNFSINILNVSSGETNTLKYYIRCIESLISKDAKVIFGRDDSQSSLGCKCISCDISLLRTFMGSNFCITPFEDGIKEMISAIKSNNEKSLT